MPGIRPTADELVSILKKSDLPTIVVEGDDDMTIYRWLESRINVPKVDVLACGGRTALLEIYSRRHEFSHLKVAFMADRDMWLFSSIPLQYSGIIWTTGYSIENDLYAGSNLEGLLDPSEATQYHQELQCIIEWFAFEVEEYSRGNAPRVDTHPNEIVLPGTNTICQSFVARRGYSRPSANTLSDVRNNYQLKVRGKTLLQLLARFLDSQRRGARHNVSGLHEIAVKTTPSHVYVNRLVTDAQQALI
jgi:hypothetical protein